MNYIEVMEKCEKYIGEHLEYPPTAMELAEYSGYSLYHFCHLFRAHFGVPVAEYISHKKLEKAAENIASGMSITESAIRAGYDTPSGFAKAFRKSPVVRWRNVLVFCCFATVLVAKESVSLRKAGNLHSGFPNCSGRLLA